MRTAIAMALAACTAAEHVDPERDRCEIEAELRGAECAVVYQFAAPYPNELGYVELCVPERYLDDAQARYGVAHPSESPRFEQYTHGLVDPPCFWCASPGANALNGCWQVEP